MLPDMQDWEQYMQSRGVSQEDRMKAGNFTMNTARGSRDVIVESLEGTAKDHFGALSVRHSSTCSTVTCSPHRCTARDANASTSP